MRKICSNIYYILVLVSYSACNSIFATEEFTATDTIKKRVTFYKEIASEARDKNITVFIGNTGVGKSTLINTLSGFPLKIDTRGKIVLDGNHQEASSIGAGVHSITICPQHFFSNEIGDIYDLPGFLDTRGSVENFLNAAAIRSLLTTARGVRVILVTSPGELEDAAHGFLAKELDKAISMFDDRLLYSNACLTVINSVEQEIVNKDQKHPAIINLLEDFNNIRKINPEKILLLKKARANLNDDTVAREVFLTEFKTSLLHTIKSIDYQPVKRLNMTYTFSSETYYEIKIFLINSLKSFMNKPNDEFFKKAIADIQNSTTINAQNSLSQILKSMDGLMWSNFKKSYESTSDYELFYEICTNQYRDALEEFSSSFYQEHTSIIRMTEIMEKENEKEIALQAKEEAEKKAQQLQQEAVGAQKHAELLQQETMKAQQREKEAREEAKAAQKDVLKSQEEKELANQLAKEALEKFNKAKIDFENSSKDSADKMRKAEEEQVKAREAAEQAQNCMLALEETLKEQAKKRDQELAQMKSEHENEKLEKQQYIEKMKRSGDKREREYQQQLTLMNEDNRRRENEMHQRHQQQISILDRSRENNNNVSSIWGIVKDVVSIGAKYFIKK